MHRSAVKQIGLEKYVKGVSTLFDPASEVDLISIKQVDDTTFKTRWRLGATVNFPFKLTLKPYLGGSTYKVNQDHLIQSQTVRAQPACLRNVAGVGCYVHPTQHAVHTRNPLVCASEPPFFGARALHGH